ncbi:MAG: hypothetical protein WC728_12135 [Elusimicrobiota bacterium]
MRNAALALSTSLLLACGTGRRAYGPDDPLAGAAKPELFGISGASFSAVVPRGYVRAEAGGLPVAAMFIRTLPGGEADIVVERYTESADGISVKTFAENLGPKESARFLTRHKVGDRTLEAYHGMDFESYARQISSEDPYSDSLGTGISPPRLSLLENRRFPKGGDAYRLYRCRKLGAWGILADYRRGLKKGQAAGSFWEGLPVADRRIVAACFGQAAAAAMRGGGEPPETAKPSRYRLRIMARDEWTHGAARLVERECVHIRPAQDGFWAVRLRAPRADFARAHEAFETFLGSFEPR